MAFFSGKRKFLPKPQKFRYQPRVYDERKETLEARISQIKSEMNKDYSSASSEERLRSKMKKEWTKPQRKSGVNILGNLKPILFLGLIAMAIYYISQNMNSFVANLTQFFK